MSNRLTQQEKGLLAVAHIKCHPRYRLIVRNLGPLDKLQRKVLIVKGKCEDGTGRRPCADHEVMDRHYLLLRRCKMRQFGREASWRQWGLCYAKTTARLASSRTCETRRALAFLPLPFLGFFSSFSSSSAFLSGWFPAASAGMGKEWLKDRPTGGAKRLPRPAPPRKKAQYFPPLLLLTQLISSR